MMGYWQTYPGAANPLFTAALKNTHRDWPYLYPISKAVNSNFKGVVAVHGTVGVSGNVQGHITMYDDGSVAILDNLRLTNPADTNCQHLMGIVAGQDILAGGQRRQRAGGRLERPPPDAERLQRSVCAVHGDGADVLGCGGAGQ